MASVTKLIKDFARSPKGQQLIEQVKEQAGKPENRRKLEELRKRYAKRRSRAREPPADGCPPQHPDPAILARTIRAGHRRTARPRSLAGQWFVEDSWSDLVAATCASRLLC